MDNRELEGPLGTAFVDDDFVARRLFEVADAQAQQQKIVQEIEIARQQKTSGERSRLDVFHNRLSHFEDVTETHLRECLDLSESERCEHLAGLAKLVAEMRKHPESCNWF
jgi:hypothetical protein